MKYIFSKISSWIFKDQKHIFQRSEEFEKRELQRKFFQGSLFFQGFLKYLQFCTRGSLSLFFKGEENLRNLYFKVNVFQDQQLKKTWIIKGQVVPEKNP